ncbi:MAG: nucleotidyltransferase domain-containing protein [Thermomicrobiales bacterium]
MEAVVIHPSIEAHRHEITQLCEEYGVARLEVFGSAVSGEFDPDRSDVDFLVEFGDRFRYGDLDFKEALKSLLGREVQLVSRKYLRNPYFIRAVEATKVPSMLPRSPKLLWDIHNAADRILEWAEGKSIAELLSDDWSRLSVERLEILGRLPAGCETTIPKQQKGWTVSIRRSRCEISSSISTTVSTMNESGRSSSGIFPGLREEALSLLEEAEMGGRAWEIGHGR